MSRKLTTNQFINRAKEIHGSTYDYSLTDYVNSDSNVIIICKEHGKFNIRAANHTSHKRGCKKCSAQKLSSEYTKTTKSFISKANKIHSNFYDYSKVNYIHCDQNIIITCPVHGDFQQRPSNHLSNRGCKKCGFSKISEFMKDNTNGWTYSSWGKAAKSSKNFDSFKVYVIRCWNDDEEFYKIGKTYNTLEKRFKSINIPYNWEEVETFEGEAKDISEKENLLQTKHKNYKYVPKLKFNGMYECFSKIK